MTWKWEWLEQHDYTKEFHARRQWQSWVIAWDIHKWCSSIYNFYNVSFTIHLVIDTLNPHYLIVVGFYNVYFVIQQETTMPFSLFIDFF